MSIIRADSIKIGPDGAPDLPNGITVTGIVTATTLIKILLDSPHSMVI